MFAEAVQPLTGVLPQSCQSHHFIHLASNKQITEHRSRSYKFGDVWGTVLCSPNFKKPLRIRPWCWNCFVVSFQMFDGYTTTLKRFNCGCNHPILLISTFLHLFVCKWKHLILLDHIQIIPNISNIHTILQHDTAMSRCFSSVYPGNPWRSGAP